MDISSDNNLLARVRDGDESGFEELVSTHSPRVISLAWRMTGNRDDAEDIAQEAFLRLHRHIKTFRGDSSVATWLHRTVTRLAIDHLRRRKLKDRIFFFRRGNDEPDPLDSAPSDTPSPGQGLLDGEIRQRLETALQKLSARQRIVFTLRHYEEMPLREISELLNLEEGTVKSHLHRAVRILRREMEDLKEEPR